MTTTTTRTPVSREPATAPAPRPLLRDPAYVAWFGDRKSVV